MDREAWRAAVQEVAKSRTQLSDWTELGRTSLWSEMLVGLWKSTRITVITDRPGRGGWTVTGTERERAVWLQLGEGLHSSMKKSSCCQPLKTDWGGTRDIDPMTHSPSFLPMPPTRCNPERWASQRAEFGWRMIQRTKQNITYTLCVVRNVYALWL